MWWNRKLRHNCRCSEKDTLIKSYEADLKRLQKKQDDAVVTDCQTAEFVVDWSKMNAFSIERHGGDKQAYTIIGYHNKDNDVEEWKFYCSQQQHNKLAKEFKDAITKQDNSTVR